MSAASVICPVFQPEEFQDLTSFINQIEDLDYGPFYQIGKPFLHTVWKLRKFTFTLFLQKFRESNVLNEGTKAR